MYDDLILRLRDAAKMSEALAVFLPHSEGSAVAKLYNEAADTIEELSKSLDDMNEANIALYGALPKWIPVTERLPDSEDEVVVAFKNSADGEWWYRIDNFVDGQFCYNSAFKRHIEYWMPLPQPPEEG